MELILTTGLVSVILGTASGAQNIGLFGALGVGGYIALAGLWGSPISGASMNPARTFGPDLVSATFTAYWVYVAGPIAGAVIAVGIAFVLRGPGGGESGSGAAQGDLFTEIPRGRQVLTGHRNRALGHTEPTSRDRKHACCLGLAATAKEGCSSSIEPAVCGLLLGRRRSGSQRLSPRRLRPGG